MDLSEFAFDSFSRFTNRTERDKIDKLKVFDEEIPVIKLPYYLLLNFYTEWINMQYDVAKFTIPQRKIVLGICHIRSIKSIKAI